MTGDMQGLRFELNQDPSTVFLSEEVEATQCGSERICLVLKALAGMARIVVLVLDELERELLVWLHC